MLERKRDRVRQKGGQSDRQVGAGSRGRGCGPTAPRPLSGWKRFSLRSPSNNPRRRCPVEENGGGPHSSPTHSLLAPRTLTGVLRADEPPRHGREGPAWPRLELSASLCLVRDVTRPAWARVPAPPPAAPPGHGPARHCAFDASCVTAGESWHVPRSCEHQITGYGKSLRQSLAQKKVAENNTGTC